MVGGGAVVGALEAPYFVGSWDEVAGAAIVDVMEEEDGIGLDGVRRAK